MKKCSKCGSTKLIDEFYKQTASSDGHSGNCKECTAECGRKYAESDAGKAKAKAYRNTPARREYHESAVNKSIMKKHRQTEGYKITSRAKSARQRKLSPTHVMAHNAVNNAIRGGTLIRPSECERCNCECKPHGHHESYEPEHWLNVKWLCCKCHTELHIKKEKVNYYAYPVT